MKPNLPSKSNSAAMGHSSYGETSSGSLPDGSPPGARGSKPPSEGEHSPSNTSLKSRSGPNSQQGSPRTRVPLKTILQNFLNHVESLESEEPTGDPMGQTTYELEFRRLKAFSDSLKPTLAATRLNKFHSVRYDTHSRSTGKLLSNMQRSGPNV